MEAEFLVAESPFASGGFRRAFKATSITEGFKEVTWVVKKYLKSASEIHTYIHTHFIDAP